MSTVCVHPGALSDEELVARILNGETDLYEIIMRRYNQRLFRVTRSIVRDADEAEDVMQDAYVRAYEHLNQFAGRAKFSTWLTRIAVHGALARVNARKRNISLSNANEGEANLMDTLPSREPGPEAATGDAETRRLLESAIDALPENYRSVFVLREVEGLNTADVAACLDLHEEAVKVRLHRARRMLRDDLYSRVGTAGSNAFAFMGEQCDRVVRNVMARLASRGA